VSRHKGVEDKVVVRNRTAAQRKRLEDMGWTIQRRASVGYRLISPDGEKVIRTSCCLHRALNMALAYEATRK
jgi:hypothetical protein